MCNMYLQTLKNHHYNINYISCILLNNYKYTDTRLSEKGTKTGKLIREVKEIADLVDNDNQTIQ